jgi:hypothetical protein
MEAPRGASAVLDERTRTAEDSALDWRPSAIRLIEVGLLAVLLFGAGTGAASADGLLGLGGNDGGSGGDGEGVVGGVTDTLGEAAAGLTGDGGSTGNVAGDIVDTAANDVASGAVAGATEAATGVVDTVTGDDVLPADLGGCVPSTCGSNQASAGNAGANPSTQGIAAPLTTGGNATTDGATDARGAVVVNAAGLEVTDGGAVTPGGSTAGIVDHFNVCAMGCPTGASTGVLATANVQTRPDAIVPGVSAVACVAGTCDTELMNGYGVLVGKVGIDEPNGIVGTSGLSVCLIGQCAAGPGASLNAIGGLLLTSEGGIVPFIDGVACIVGNCTLNGQQFTGVLFTEAQTGDILGLGPLGATVCVPGVCPAAGVNGPSSPTDPNAMQGQGGPNPLPVGMMNLGDSAGEAGSSGTGIGPSGVHGAGGGSGGFGPSAPQSGTGPKGGLPNTGFAPLDAMLDSPASFGLLLAGLLAIVATWSAGMRRIFRSRRSTSAAWTG